jgi:hypothetical protein
MAISTSTSSLGCSRVFNPKLPHDVRQNITELAQAVTSNCNEPYLVLNTLHKLLKGTAPHDKFGAQALALMLEPLLAQLDVLRCDACTLLSILDPDAVQ